MPGELSTRPARGLRGGAGGREGHLAGLALPPRGPFDLIFADPPYDTLTAGESFTRLLLRNDRLPLRLTSDGIFVLEKRPGERLPTTDFWEVTRRKTYGATETIFLQRNPAKSNMES